MTISYDAYPNDTSYLILGEKETNARAKRQEILSIDDKLLMNEDKLKFSQLKE